MISMSVTYPVGTGPETCPGSVCPPGLSGTSAP